MLIERCSDTVQTLKNPRGIVPTCHGGFKSLKILTGLAWSQIRGICVRGVVKIVDAKPSQNPRKTLAKLSQKPRKSP